MIESSVILVTYHIKFPMPHFLGPCMKSKIQFGTDQTSWVVRGGRERGEREGEWVEGERRKGERGEGEREKGRDFSMNE